MAGQNPSVEGMDPEMLALVSSMEAAPLPDPAEMTREQLEAELVRSQLDSSSALVAIAETLTEDTEEGETVLDVLKGIRSALTDLVKVARDALGQTTAGG